MAVWLNKEIVSRRRDWKKWVRSGMRDSGWVFAKGLSRSVSDEARLPGKCQNKKALMKNHGTTYHEKEPHHVPRRKETPRSWKRSYGIDIKRRGCCRKRTKGWCLLGLSIHRTRWRKVGCFKLAKIRPSPQLCKETRRRKHRKNGTEVE